LAIDGDLGLLPAIIDVLAFELKVGENGIRIIPESEPCNCLSPNHSHVAGQTQSFRVTQFMYLVIRKNNSFLTKKNYGFTSGLLKMKEAFRKLEKGMVRAKANILKTGLTLHS
jgi:hypothetical protein